MPTAPTSCPPQTIPDRKETSRPMGRPQVVLKQPRGKGGPSGPSCLPSVWGRGSQSLVGSLSPGLPQGHPALLGTVGSGGDTLGSSKYSGPWQSGLMTSARQRAPHRAGCPGPWPLGLRSTWTLLGLRKSMRDETSELHLLPSTL